MNNSPHNFVRKDLARKIRGRVPEIEVGVTCSIVVIPLPMGYKIGQLNILADLEEISLSTYFRKDYEGKYWKTFVVPFQAVAGGDLWDMLASNFGVPIYYEEVC